jgi:hypothetical protein
MTSLSLSGFAAKESTVSGGLLLPHATSADVHRHAVILLSMFPILELGCEISFSRTKRTDAVDKVA